MKYLSIPKLANRLGVTSASVRDWIKRGYIEPPLALPVTGERVYPAHTADHIERWYMERAANGGTRGPGAKERRELAREWLASAQTDQQRRSDVAMQFKNPATIVTEEVQKWLELDDDLLPVVPLVVAVANRLTGPPVWLMIVAPPSSGKSDVIMGVSAIKGVHALSTVTPKTFASGMKPSEDAKKPPSLLERLLNEGKWLLAIKDFGTILSLPPLQRNPILGQLREIYDGKYNAHFGTGVAIDWQGKLGLLVGATPSVDRQYKWNAELGERFVQFRPSVPDPRKVALWAAVVASKEKERKAALRQAYRDAFAAALRITRNKEDRKTYLRPEGYLIGSALAQFVANGRRPVFRQRGAFDTGYEVLPPEGPARLTKVFKQIHTAALICYDGDLDAATRLVARVAANSIPGKRGKLLRELARNPDGVTIRAMAAVLECDENTAQRELDDIVAIGFAERSQPAKTAIYSASARLLDYAAQVFLDEYEAEEALRKLFDLPNNITSEREGEKKEVGVC